MWNFSSVGLETMLVSVQDKCLLCAKDTIGSKIILEHPTEILGDVGHVESSFGPFRDSDSIGAR
jgi:hypothetical protein